MECDHHGDDTGDKLDGEGIMRVNVIVMEMILLMIITRDAPDIWLAG